MKTLKEKWDILRATGATEMPEELILRDDMDHVKIWEEYVKEDPGAICGQFTEHKTMSDVRRTNANLYEMMGVLNYLRPWGTIVEIGSGLEAFELLLNRYHQYIPFDILKHRKTTNILKGDGTIPCLDGIADFIICHNVFQHLTPKQRALYMDESCRVLKDRCRMFLSVTIDSDKNTDSRTLLGGQRWTVTGDYFTPYCNWDEVISWLSKKWNILSKIERYDAFTGLWMEKIEESVDESN